MTPNPDNADVTSDDELVARTIKGDRKALDFLIRRYETSIYGFLLRMTRNPADAEDLVQEIFLRMFRSLERYQPRGLFRSWLFTIARNCCKSAAEKKSRDTGLMSSEQAFDQACAETRSAGDNGHEEMDAMLASLPEESRRVIVLRYVVDLSCSEIAAIEQISEEAVRQRLHRARVMIRKNIE